MDLFNTVCLILISARSYAPGTGDKEENETDVALALVHLSAQEAFESSPGSASMPGPLVSPPVTSTMYQTANLDMWWLGWFQVWGMAAVAGGLGMGFNIWEGDPQRRPR